MPCSSENPICSHRKKKMVFYTIFIKGDVNPQAGREKKNQSMGLKDKENGSVNMELGGIKPARLSSLKLLQRSMRKEQECKNHLNSSSFWFSWNCLPRETPDKSPPALDWATPSGSPSREALLSFGIVCQQRCWFVFWQAPQRPGWQQGRSCGCQPCRPYWVFAAAWALPAPPQTIITIPNKFLILSQQHPCRRLVRHPGVMFYL